MKEKLNDNLLRDVTLKQLNAIEAIARTGKVTSAASELGVTPPAVTLQLKQVEAALGLALFERTPRGLRPTDAGLYVVAVQARMAALIEEANETVLEMKGIGRGRLRIGAVSAGQYFVPRLLSHFAKAHPRIEVELFIANRAGTIAELATMGLDFAIMGRPPESLETEHHIIGEHPHVMIAESAHPLCEKRRIALEALAGETFLLREDGSGTRHLMQRTLAMARLEPRHVMTFASNETVKQAVMAGLGVAFISAHTIAHEAETGRLSVLRVQGFPVIRHWYAVRLQQRRLGPAANAMWRYVLDEGTTFLPAI